MPDEQKQGIDFQKMAEHLVPAKWNSTEGVLTALGLGVGALALLYFGLPIAGTILSGAAATVTGLAGLSFAMIKFILGATVAVSLGMFVTSKGFRTGLRRTILAAAFRYRRWQILRDPVTMIRMAVDEQQAIYERGREAVVRFHGSVQKQLAKIDQLKAEYDQLIAHARAMKKMEKIEDAILLAEKAQGIKDDVEKSRVPDYMADAVMALKLDKAVSAAYLRVGRMRNTADRYADKMQGVEERRAARSELGAVLGTSESAELFAASKEELERQFALDLAEGDQFNTAISGVVAEMDADRMMNREKSLAFLDALDAQGSTAAAINIPAPVMNNWTVPEDINALKMQGRAAARTR